jgi:integrase
MAKKRGNNEGSIHKRTNGSWRAQVSLDGKRMSRTFKTNKECVAWIRKTNNKIDKGLSYETAQYTVEAFMKRWLTNSKSSLRPKTWHQYEQITRDYISPDLGKIKLVALRPDLIQTVYDKHLDAGVGVRTVQLVHSVLRRCLNQAVKLGILQRNPTVATSPPKAEYKEMKFFDAGQAQLLLITSKAKGDRYATLYQLALTTGMRQGELLGLQWKDINWDKRILRIQRQLSRIPGGKLKYEKPKTRSSVRALSLGEATIIALKEHQMQQFHETNQAGTRWQDFDLIFPSSTGTPTNPFNLYYRSFKPLLKDAGLPDIRFHDLRHTAASLMLNNGVSVLAASKRLGHAQPSITLNTYGHLVPGIQEEIASIMDEVITPITLADPQLVAPGCTSPLKTTKTYPPDIEKT